MNLFELYLYKENDYFKISSSSKNREKICENVEFLIDEKKNITYKYQSIVTFTQQNIYSIIDNKNSSLFCTYLEMKCDNYFSKKKNKKSNLYLFFPFC